jgi:hypothetical protein
MSGMDPETNTNAGSTSATAVVFAAAGTAQNRLLTTGLNTPSTRNYIFGLNLTF